MLKKVFNMFFILVLFSSFVVAIDLPGCEGIARIKLNSYEYDDVYNPECVFSDRDVWCPCTNESIQLYSDKLEQNHSVVIQYNESFNNLTTVKRVYLNDFSFRSLQKETFELSEMGGFLVLFLVSLQTMALGVFIVLLIIPRTGEKL
jgi:hypothetical protein